MRALALEHYNRIEALLAVKGRRVSAITVQKILNEHDLGSRYEILDPGAEDAYPFFA